MDNKRIKTAVLSCGNGDYLQTLLDSRYFGNGEDIELTVILTDEDDCAAARRARLAHAPVFPIERAMFPTQRSFDRAIFEKLDDLDVDLVVMAEWAYPLPGEILRRWEKHILCLCPELRKAPEAEVCVSACLLEENGAPGAVLLERSMPIRPGDTAEAITRRMAAEDGELLWKAAEMLCSGRLCIYGRQTKLLPEGLGIEE